METHANSIERALYLLFHYRKILSIHLPVKYDLLLNNFVKSKS